MPPRQRRLSPITTATRTALVEGLMSLHRNDRCPANARHTRRPATRVSRRASTRDSQGPLRPKGDSMLTPIRRIALVCTAVLLPLFAEMRPAAATSEVFLSNDVALSEATYVIQFDTAVAARIGTI